MSKASLFRITAGVLTQYRGNGKTVIIPAGVTAIGDMAFDGCGSITAVSIPEGVTSIGEKAFAWCPNLKSVSIPQSVVSIGNEAFNHCSKLAGIHIPDAVTVIGEGAFAYCTALTCIHVPDSVTSIGKRAFFDCKALTRIRIPEGVGIGSGAFHGCRGLADQDGFVIIRNVLYDYCGSAADVIVPQRVTAIDNRAFLGFQHIETVSIGNSVTSIGSEAFFHCSNLTSVTLPANITAIEPDTFSCCERLAAVTIPDTVTSIGRGAFYSCSSLEAVRLPENIASIGALAFAWCENLASIRIPEEASIDSGAFCKCPGLANKDGFVIFRNVLHHYCGSADHVTIPQGVFAIGNGAFYGCMNLVSVTIAAEVTTIGPTAFEQCHNLVSVTVGKDVTDIDERAFYKCKNLAQLVLPDRKISIGYNAFSNCAHLADKDGFVIVRQTLYGYYGQAGDVTIPEGVTTIEDRAFYGCSSLEDLRLPQSLTKIGEAAFSRCPRLKMIDLPASVKVLGAPFQNSDGIRMLIAPGIAPQELEETGLLPAATAGYLAHCERYCDPDAIQAYQKYSTRYKKQILSLLFSLDAAQGIAQYIKMRKINRRNFEADFLQPALAANAHQCVALLLDRKNKHRSLAEPEQLGQGLMTDPFSVSAMKKLWSFKALSDGSVCITGYKGTHPVIEIPHRIGEMPVTAIGGSAFNPSRRRISRERAAFLASLESITIPDSITSIDRSTFGRSVILCVHPGSEALRFALEHNFPHRVI